MLWRMLRRTAEARGDAPLLWEGDRTLTARELLGAGAAAAARFRREGVAAGDAVGLMLPSGIDLAAAIYGVLALGATVVPLPPSLRRVEAESSLVPCRPRLLVCPTERVAELGGLAPRTIAGAALGEGSGAPAPEPSLDPERAAFILFSTGSTGRAKRLVRTHAMMAAEARQFGAAVALGPEDRILGPPPLYHSYGICCVLIASVYSGAGARLYPAFHPERLLADATRERSTVLVASPFHLSILARMAPRIGTDLRALRWCLSCGSSLPGDVFRGFHDRYGVSIRQLYGASEVASVSLNVDADPAASAASAGIPLPGVSVRVVREDGTDALPGEVGEIAVRSQAASERYEDLPELSRVAFRDGWFFSGDLGTLDVDGRLQVTGRVKLLINVGANKVDPLEVESALELHPGVAEAAVVGVSGEHGVEVVKAVVVTRGAVSEDEIVGFCAARLSAYKVPRRVEFRTELPRSPTGKLLRKDLLEEGP